MGAARDAVNVKQTSTRRCIIFSTRRWFVDLCRDATRTAGSLLHEHDLIAVTRPFKRPRLPALMVSIAVCCKIRSHCVVSKRGSITKLQQA